MDDEPSDAPAGPPSGPVKRGARVRRAALFLFSGPALLLLGLWALVATGPGLQALVAVARVVVPELRVDGVTGRLMGPLEVERLEVRQAQWWFDARGLTLDWQPADLLAGRLTLKSLGARQLDLAVAPSPQAPTLPATLVLPGSVRLAQLNLTLLRVLVWPEDGTLPTQEQLVLRALTGRASSDGQGHQLEDLQILTPVGRLSLSGHLAGAAPFALEARGVLGGEREGRTYHLEGALSGTLASVHLALRGEGAGLSGTGAVDLAPFEGLPLQGLALDLGRLDPAAFNPAWPQGALQWSAQLARDPQGDLVGPMTVVNHRPAALDKGGMPLTQLQGRLRWREGFAGIEGLRLSQPGGGELQGAGVWRGGEGGGVTADLKAVALDLAALHGSLPATRLSGPLTLRADPARQSMTANLVDKRFAVELAVRREGASARLEKLALRAGSGVLRATGELGLEGARVFSLAGTLQALDPAQFLMGAPAGKLDLSLTAEGHLAPQLQGDLRYQVDQGRLGGQTVAGAGRLKLADGVLQVPALWLKVGLNRLEARGGLGVGTPGLSVVVDAPRLDQLGLGLMGRGGVELQLSGSLSDPALAGTVYGERLILPGGLRVGGVNLQGIWGAGPSGAVAVMAGASRIGPVGEADDWLAGLAMQWEGRRNDHILALVAQPDLGQVWQARLAGGLGADGRWRGHWQQLQAPGSLTMVLEAPAALEFGVEGGFLGATRLRVGAGRVDLEETRWSAAATVLRGRLQGLGVGPRAGGVGSQALRLGGEWDIRLGPRADGYARLYRESGDLVVEGDNPGRLGLTALTVEVKAQGGRVAASLGARGAQLGVLDAQGSVLVERGPGGWRLDPGGPLQGTARLLMPDLTWLGPLTSPTLRTEGALDAEFALAGTPGAPISSGRVQGRGLGLALGDLGLRLAGGRLEAEFDQERLLLKRLEFVSANQVRPRDKRVPVAALTAEPGGFSAHGSVALSSGAGRFEFSARRLPLLQHPDRWLVVSGSGEARTGWNSLDIAARLVADGGYLGLSDRPPPSLSEDVVILGRHGPGEDPGRRFSADVTVDLGRQLYLSALGVDTRLEGSLRLVGRSGQPLAATGTVTTVGGVFEGYGQKLAIERGRVNFLGPLDNPGMNIVALRKGLAVEAGLAITGTARRPKVQLVSEPTVPDAEKLAWIVLGHPPDSAAGGDLALLIPAAQALLGGTGGQITSSLAGSLGLDQLALGQGGGRSPSGAGSSVVGGATDSATGTVSGQVLTLGKSLSSDVFVSFEQSLSGAESIVRLSYRLSRRLALVASAGTDNGVDLNYSFSFR